MPTELPGQCDKSLMRYLTSVFDYLIMNIMSAEEKIEEKNKPRVFKSLFVILVSVLVGAGLVYAVAKQKPEFLGLPKGSAQVQAEVDRLVSEVGSLIALPSDEKPTVATITDIEKLKDQQFFKNAKNEDKVLIYTNAKKAILYRASEKRIIEVGAVNINQATPSPSPKVSPEPKEED